MKKGEMVSSSFLNEENCIICKNNFILRKDNLIDVKSILNIRSFIFIFFILLLINISFISAQTYTLKVTDEHPFYVINDFINVMQDGKSDNIESSEGIWKKANELKIGDLLLTDNGNKAKITSIKEVYENVDVYNLHVDGLNDYFANGVLVHNKLPPEPGMGWETSISINAADIPAFKEAYGRLNELAPPPIEIDYELIPQPPLIPGIRRAGGSMRATFIIDPKTVPLDQLPPVVKKFIIDNNIQEPFALKYITGNRPVEEELLVEFLWRDKLNDELMRDPCVGERIFAKVYGRSFGLETIEGIGEGDFTAEGLIEGMSAAETRTALNKWSNEHQTNVQARIKAAELKRRTHTKAIALNQRIAEFLKRNRLRWTDDSPSNWVIQFRDKRTGKILNSNEAGLDSLITGDISLDDITIHFRAYEFGGVVPLSADCPVLVIRGNEIGF